MATKKPLKILSAMRNFASISRSPWAAGGKRGKGNDDENCYNSGVGTKNARLIAAAPELLEILEVIVKAAALSETNLDDDQRYVEIRVDHIDAARAIIAKAKGE